MSRVVLHIGTHKTASTTIQDRLWAFAPQLAEHGLIYPRFNQISGHHGLARDWIRLPEVYNLPDGSKGTLRALAQEYGDKDVTVFLSSEELSRAAPDGGVNYSELRSCLDGFSEIQVVCVLRTQWQFMQSVYLELSKTTCPPVPPKLLEATTKNGMFAGLLADYNLLLDRLESVFAPDEIKLFDFESIRADEHGVIGCILRDLGFDLPTDIMSEMATGASNVSPPALASWTANILCSPNPAPRWLVDRMQIVLRDRFGDDMKTCLFTRAEFNRLKKHFVPLNEKLATRRAPYQPGFRLAEASASGLTHYRDDIDADVWRRVGRNLTHELMAKIAET